MPPKVSELISTLLSAGFQDRGGKGSHRNLRYPDEVNITLSGKPGDDAKYYQVRDVKQALELVGNEK